VTLSEIASLTATKRAKALDKRKLVLKRSANVGSGSERKKRTSGGNKRKEGVSRYQSGEGPKNRGGRETARELVNYTVQRGKLGRAKPGKNICKT